MQIDKPARVIVLLLLVLHFMSAVACGARHAIGPAMRVAEYEDPSSRAHAYVSASSGQGNQQNSAIPVVLVPAGIGIKKLLVGGGAMVLGGVLLGFCIGTGACAPGSKPKEKSEGAVNRPPPPRDPPDERCKKVAEDCRTQCLDELPTSDFGFAFWNCVNACLAKNGCSPGMY